jgi:hypothetical protein
VVAATAPDGSGGSESDLAVREVSTSAAAAKKATEIRTTEEVMTVKAAEEAVMKTTDQGAVGAKATVESAGSGSNHAPAVGTKRAAASGGSTPPSMRFRCTWKPWYAGQLCSHLFLFFYLY